MFRLEIDRYRFFFFRADTDLLVVKEADNRYLEPIVICSKSEHIGVKILNTNKETIEQEKSVIMKTSLSMHSTHRKLYPFHLTLNTLNFV